LDGQVNKAVHSVSLRDCLREGDLLPFLGGCAREWSRGEASAERCNKYVKRGA
jgi:hypothetical protein